jgi:hypothetical protein
MVDEVIERHDDPVVCTATDLVGQRWLIIEAVHQDQQQSWLCAPASARAVDLVASGKAAAVDAVRHSSTGWVELVSVVDGHAVPDRRVPCSDIDNRPFRGALQPA